jgi:diguanylate cyclase (GGDEF)-like protein
MSDRVANDDDGAGDSGALAREVDRLRSEIARLQARVNELDDLANLDPLVGLPNRRGFEVRLADLLARVNRHGDEAAMVFVDVDGLKDINDKFGHVAGDDALIEIGRMLVASVRSSDCVARLGGDEFGVLLERTDELSAWQMALRIVETVMGSEFCVAGSCLPLSVAVGVGPIKPGDDAKSVIERADKEMYRVKAA